MTDWQKEQARKCPCDGADDYCPCQNRPSLGCPIEPYSLGKSQLAGLEDLVRRVAGAAMMNGLGNHFLVRVYLAGLFHGIELSKDEK